MAVSPHPTLRHFVWDLCEPDEAASALESRLHIGLLVLILLNVAAVVLGSVASIATQYGRWLDRFELFSVVVFSVEYLARLWSCTADARYAHPVWGRLKFACSPMALVDLAAVLPFYLAFTQLDLRFVRAFRLMRLFRLAKAGRYSEASTVLLRVMRSKREEMFLSLGVLLTLTIVFATLMYMVEGDVQPDKFPDIPHALWWAVVTITTVGYGDVFPVTPLGKLVGAATALLGILMIALPTGVFGAAFVEELNNRRKPKGNRCCPHCGKPVE